MFKHLGFLRTSSYIAIFTILLGCSNEQSETSASKSVEKVQLSSGIDKQNMDLAIRPQDDFYRYVNGTWLKTTTIPADKSNYGAFTTLVENSQLALREIIEQAASNTEAAIGSEQKKLGDFYNAYMDLATAERKGIAPIQQELTAIQKVTNHTQLTLVFALLDKSGVKTPFGWYVNNDAKQSTVNALYVLQSGLGMPDRDYYLKDADKFNKIRQSYLTYVQDMLVSANYNQTGQAELAAQQVIELETKLAQVQWTRVQSRNADKRYNKLEKAQLNKLLGANFDWNLFAEQVGFAHADTVIVAQPSFFEGVGQLLISESIEVWQAYLTFHVINSKAKLLNKDLVDRHFAFHSKVISGIEQQKPRWKKAVDSADDVLGEMVGKLYVEKHFKPEAKQRMQELVANLIQAFDSSIDNLAWMSPATKQAAKLKLSKFTPKIGYPDKWKDYSNLTIKADDLVGNFVRYNQWLTQEYVSRIGKPVDRSEWFMTPQTVNAYFNPVNNEIVFPAAILQPPFFNLEAEDAVNYGAIGAVIGHEIGHGFDDQGAKYNGDGNLQNWWSQNDLNEFQARGRTLVEQFNGYKPFRDVRVNGKLTLGENIGDLGGLTVALKAYLLSLNGKPAPEIDGFSGTQRFFMGWGQIWRRLYREPELRRRLVTDPHSPSEYRVKGIVPNIPEFYQAFDVKAGDGMYIAPENRVKIW
ncbi:peptidase M13 [Saccharobesus litoralis]|uniref:Peptidase M13 n=1 Tax=Saccharobesus litoralis TaxID=2172099 RepID=A0A2S0VR00_9ALTE|nr:M13-type metalloendopeptidase [Saccharobesus litoralis]AWB66643.1 peptidase M13 [Saccharobesus litoralis]